METPGQAWGARRGGGGPETLTTTDISSAAAYDTHVAMHVILTACSSGV
jgi:hypothetical protein